MAQKQYIKHLYEIEEISLREIARRTTTVSRLSRNTHTNRTGAIEPQSYPVLGDFIPTIDEWLEADRKVPRKQRHTVWRNYCRL